VRQSAGQVAISYGNLAFSQYHLQGGTSHPTIYAMPGGGVYYSEVLLSVGNTNVPVVGVIPNRVNQTSTTNVFNGGVGWGLAGQIWVNGTQVATTTQRYADGDRVGVVIDRDNDQVTFSVNGTVAGTWDLPLPEFGYGLTCDQQNTEGNNSFRVIHGQQPFQHQPAGTLPLSTAELPAVDITNPS
jgi:hypothetical protein